MGKFLNGYSTHNWEHAPKHWDWMDTLVCVFRLECPFASSTNSKCTDRPLHYVLQRPRPVPERRAAHLVQGLPPDRCASYPGVSAITSSSIKDKICPLTQSRSSRPPCRLWRTLLPHHCPLRTPRAEPCAPSYPSEASPGHVLWRQGTQDAKLQPV